MTKVGRIRALKSNICPYCGRHTLKSFTRGVYGSVLWTECPDCGEWKLLERGRSEDRLGDTELVSDLRGPRDKDVAEAVKDKGTDRASDSGGGGEGWTKEKDRKLHEYLKRLVAESKINQADRKL